MQRRLNKAYMRKQRRIYFSNDGSSKANDAKPEPESR